MKISGFLAESFQDWDKGLSSVIFTGNCNFRCPACYANKLLCSDELFTADEILRKISRKSNYIKNVVVCGGEATLESGLEDMLFSLKKMGLSIKLDTNGSNPETLERLINAGLIDYVAMDIKAPEYLYDRVTGLSPDRAENQSVILKKIEKSLTSLQDKIPFELRTTIFPVFRDNGNYDWLSSDECIDMALWIYPLFKDGAKPRWFIQKFTARSSSEMLDKAFSKEKLPMECWETPDSLLSSIINKALSLGFEFTLR